MLTKRIVSCLDVSNGRVVKGVKFASLRDIGEASDLAAFYEAQGADEIVLLDISATIENRDNQLDTVRAVRAALTIPLSVGGGVRALKDVSLLLEAGADKVAVNTAAVENPDLLDRIAKTFGSQCTVLAVDAIAIGNRNWEVVTHAGQKRSGLDAITWSRMATELGAGEILLTSVDRDGTKSGYDLDLVSEISSTVTVPVVASGGAALPRDFLLAFEAGADAVLAASIFHEQKFTVGEVKEFLTKEGIQVRL